MDCDNPYKVLAYNIVTIYPPPIIKRLMKDTKFLRREVIREVKGQDFRGIFLDCLTDDLIENGHRIALNRELAKLGRYYYNHLDLNRMRAEIVSACARLGLEDLLE